MHLLDSQTRANVRDAVVSRDAKLILIMLVLILTPNARLGAWLVGTCYECGEARHPGTCYSE